MGHPMTATADDNSGTPPNDDSDASGPNTRQLTPAARRALAEAEERRRARDAVGEQRPAERGGQKGPDPVRYGDWEKGGIVSDF